MILLHTKITSFHVQQHVMAREFCVTDLAVHRQNNPPFHGHDIADAEYKYHHGRPRFAYRK